MDFTAAQRDLAAANHRGGPGVLMSGLAWLVAGIIWMQLGIVWGFAALFVGGMLIVPGSVLICRMVLHTPVMAKGNPLERLGLEATFVLFAGLFIAYGLLLAAPALTFPVMAIIVGARYCLFRTMYGDPFYWALAACIVAVGALAMVGLVTWPGNPALVVGLVEIGFAIALLGRQLSARID